MGFAPFSFLTLGDSYLVSHDFYCTIVPYLYRNKKGDKVQQIDSIIIGNQNISICQQTSSKMKMWGCEAARGTRDSDWSTSFDRFTLWNEDVRKIPMIFN